MPPPYNPAMASVPFYAAATLMMAAVVRAAPAAAAAVGGPPIVGWFLAGGAMFAVLGATGLAIARRRGGLRHGLRLRPLTKPDALATGRAMLAAAAASGLVLLGLWAAAGFGPSVPGLPPPTLTLPADPPGWLPLAWLPLYALNVLGEEVLWRGALLPGEERRFGRRAWLVNGAGVSVFHLPLGASLTLVVAPFLLAMAYVCQRRRSLWPSVLLHAALNATAFACAMAGLW